MPAGAPSGPRRRKRRNNMRRLNAAALVVACALGTVLVAAPVSAAPGKAKAAPASAAAAPVNINTATQAELEKLPGVGAATAKKIIAGRPFATVAALTKAGVPARTITRLTPLVTVGAAAAPVQAHAQTAASAPASTQATAGMGKATAAPVQYTAPSATGMVWVNLETKVFHREGDRYYGKTKRGKYMTEADALKAGYREAKVSAAPKRH